MLAGLGIKQLTSVNAVHTPELLYYFSGQHLPELKCNLTLLESVSRHNKQD